MGCASSHLFRRLRQVWHPVLVLLMAVRILILSFILITFYSSVGLIQGPMLRLVDGWMDGWTDRLATVRCCKGKSRIHPLSLRLEKRRFKVLLGTSLCRIWANVSKAVPRRARVALKRWAHAKPHVFYGVWTLPTSSANQRRGQVFHRPDMTGTSPVGGQRRAPVAVGLRSQCLILLDLGQLQSRDLTIEPIS